MMHNTDKAKCFTALLAAALRLDHLHGIQTAQLSVTSAGAELILFRDMPDGTLAHARYLLAWEEISLTKFDLLDHLLTDMHKKLLEADCADMELPTDKMLGEGE